jgi:adenylate cyclase
MMSLRRTTVLLIAGLLTGTGLLIGGIAYFTTRDSIQELRDSLITQTNDTVLQRMEAYFAQAAPALLFVNQTISFNPKAMSEPDWRDVSLQLALFLDSQLEITWLYFAEAETGNLLAALKDTDGRLLITRVHSDNNHNYDSFEVLENGQLKPTNLSGQDSESYDVRARPWFQSGIDKPANTVNWTPPYDFLQSGTRGLTATLTRRDTSGKALYVIGADLDLSETGEFMDSLMVGKTGAAFLIRSDGTSLLSREDRPNPRLNILRAALSSQLTQFVGNDNSNIHFNYEGVHYLAVVQKAVNSEYFTAVIIPENDYLAPVRRNAIITITIGIVILGLAGVLGVLLARRVTEPLGIISHDLEEISKLRFPVDIASFKSSISEIAKLEASVGKLKSSLRSFSRYMPKRLLRSMMSRGEEARLGGTLRRITVQFTDLAGFTRISESMTPGEAFEELHEFLEIIMDEQHRQGAITSSFTGDGTLALFNAPEDLDEHEAKAVDAALVCVHLLEQCNARRRAENKNQLHARIGINTAEVLLGNLGTTERFGYTAIGDGVNLASRLEGLNKIYGTQIIAGKATRDSTHDVFDWRKIDRITVVGRMHPTDIYEPLGRRGETAPDFLEMARAYEAAFITYQAGDFKRAMRAFEQLLESWPSDSPSQVMHSRCIEYIENGHPKDQWDGTFNAQFK